MREQAIGKAGGDLKAASAECLASAAAATDAARARGQETHVALVEHFQRWPQEIPFAKEAPIAEKAAWVAAEADRLEGDVLLGYEADAERALADVQEALLSDFVSKMSEKFGEIRDRLKELNRILERRTFHGMTYRFKKSDNPAYRDLIDFIEAFSSDVNARTGGLFAAAASPGTDTARSRATAKVRELLAGDETDIRRLEDYRLYFNFDIEMVGADGEVRGTMSGKIGVGSGGENQSPFYVAIGASLAAAYQVDQGDGASNGMALALFDEAFSKLDSGNAVNCLNFMRDVGLQTMIAAPDDKRHLFLETMDTVIDVARYNETELWTDITYTTEAGRRLLVDANPFRDGPDAFLAAGAAA